MAMKSYNRVLHIYLCIYFQIQLKAKSAMSLNQDLIIISDLSNWLRLCREFCEVGYLCCVLLNTHILGIPKRVIYFSVENI